MESNFRKYIEKLSSVGVPTNILTQRYGELIKRASIANTNDAGLAYDGSLVESIIKITLYAIQEANLLRETDGILVEQNSIIKVCFLCNIAKAIYYKASTDAYNIKRGKIYEFDDTQALYALKSGFRSLLMSQECGITFSLEEADAMVICDHSDEYVPRVRSSNLAFVVRRAFERFNKVANVKFGA